MEHFHRFLRFYLRRAIPAFGTCDFGASHVPAPVRRKDRPFLQVTWKTRDCAVKKKSSAKKKGRADVVSPFRDKLWTLFKDLAKGMDGADVVVALKQAGEEIWAAGIDDTYSNMSQQDQDDEPLGNAFDITWLTVVCIKLNETKQGKKPKTRIHS